MKCIVTAGPTHEPLDEVRRLTNFSTGRLGSELAGHLAAAGHEVVLLRGVSATWPHAPTGVRLEAFSTTADLGQRLRDLAAPDMGAVFHCAAVSDFAFGRVFEPTAGGQLCELKSPKFSTRQGPLLAELVPTPKLISSLRQWYPQALLFGWKYEVADDRPAALARARQQLADCRTDYCILNGRAYGEGFGVVAPDGQCVHCAGPAALFAALGKTLQSGRQD